jgi:hypothetical protein
MRVRPVVPQLPIVCQQHDGHRRELFGEGCQPEVRLGVDARQCPQVAHAIAAGEDSAPVLARQNRQAGRLGVSQRREDRIDIGGGRHARAQSQSQ